MYSVYKITAPNNKVYIGMTSINPVKRWAGGRGYEHNKMFWEDIIKYGWDNFRREIVLTTDNEDEAHEKEIELILYYDATKSDLGYNKRVISNPIHSSKCKGVTCINTNRKFKSLKKASKFAQVSEQVIKEACEGKRLTAGVHPKTRKPLMWKYTKHKYD